jgi:predicted nucleic acid-binding protein
MLRNFAIRDRRRLPVQLRTLHQLDDWGTSYTVRQRWVSFVLSDFASFLRPFSAVIELPLEPRIVDRSAELMTLYDLNSHDAAHLATAREHGLEHFATVDREFLRVPAPPRIWLLRDL